MLEFSSAVEVSRHSNFWDNLPMPDPAEVAAFRRQVTPGFLPSGINGFNLREGDHIALVVTSDEVDHLSLLKGFIAAGYRNSSAHEILSLELSLGRSAHGAITALEEVLGGAFDERIDVRDSDRNYGDYEPEHFTLEGMWQAMSGERSRMSSQGELLRCASEDCSLFLKWLDNPHEYLRYEARLGPDLNQLMPRSFVQLCTFRTSVLDELGLADHLDTALAMEQILASHSRVILLSDGGLSFDADARRVLRSRYPISRHRRMAVTVSSLWTRLRSFAGLSPQILQDGVERS